MMEHKEKRREKEKKKKKKKKKKKSKVEASQNNIPKLTGGSLGYSGGKHISKKNKPS